MAVKGPLIGPDPGQRVRVQEVPGNAYPLPTGLTPGDEVTLIEFNGAGYWQVERDGKRYRIFLANIQDLEKLQRGSRSNR